MEVLKVTILSPHATLFSGDALSVTSKNSSGNFDILPQHANFITIIENQLITIIKPNNEKVTFQFPLGIIYQVNNVVNIYTKPEIGKI